MTIVIAVGSLDSSLRLKYFKYGDILWYSPTVPPPPSAVRSSPDPEILTVVTVPGLPPVSCLWMRHTLPAVSFIFVLAVISMASCATAAILE